MAKATVTTAALIEKQQAAEFLRRSVRVGL
jgi:hypothetical protein